MLANFDVDSMEPIGCKTFCNQKAIKLCFGALFLFIIHKLGVKRNEKLHLHRRSPCCVYNTLC